MEGCTPPPHVGVAVRQGKAEHNSRQDDLPIDRTSGRRGSEAWLALASCLEDTSLRSPPRNVSGGRLVSRVDLYLWVFVVGEAS